MRVIVAGSMRWTDAEAIRRELTALPPDVVIVHGDSPGADALAGRIAADLGLVVERYEKTWDDGWRHGRKEAWRGLNERMLRAGADLVLAFHPAIDRSRGTNHLVMLARDAGVEVRIVAQTAEDSKDPIHD